MRSWIRSTRCGRFSWLPMALLMALFFWASSPTAASANEGDFRQLIERVSSAVETQSYYGKIHYFRLGEPERWVNLFHLATGSKGQTTAGRDQNGQLEISWVDGRFVLRTSGHGGRTDAIKLYGAPLFQRLSDEQMQDLIRNYDLIRGGRIDLAKRRADFFILSPKRDDRYQHRIWLDAETGVLLGASRRNEFNVVVEAFYFTEFHLGAKVEQEKDELSHLSPGASGGKRPLHEENLDFEKHWRVGYLPDGFFEIAKLRHSTGSLAGTDQWIFSDGLNTVSIFFKPLDKKQPDIIRAQHKRSVSVAVRHCSGFEITAVGEVPIHTVTWIISSVRRVTK